MFEANRNLETFLAKSIRTHQAGQQITLVMAAVGASSGTAEFFKDPNWSGKSYIGAPDKTGSESHSYVDIIRLDEAISEFDGRCVLFKVDVEGGEAAVIEGMEAILHRTNTLIGVIEFDPKTLSRSGASPQEFWRDLRRLGAVYILPDTRGGLARGPVENHPDHHVNLLVVSSCVDVKEILPPRWVMFVL
jgi:FkbM family methyltransferase